MNTWGGGEKWHYEVASYVVNQHYRALFVSSPGSPLSGKLMEIGISGYSVRISNLSFLNPVKIFRIVRIFKQERVGILITNLSGDMKVASIAAKITGVPRIIYHRGVAIPIRNTPINMYFFRRVLTKIIANSKETKRTILEKNDSLVPDEKIKIVYHGVCLPLYHKDITPLYKGAKDEIILGSAGRLSEEKGHLYLLEMMQLLQSSAIRFRLLIAGEGRLLHALEKKAKQLAVDNCVEFLGFVEDMPAFYRSLDVYLLSSQYEGFGYVIAEAMASRKPVVAFDIKSSSEIIDHGITGFITERNNARDMAGRVLELAKNKSLRDRMGMKGRKRVEALFSLEKSQKKILEIITRSNGF